jgi:hypothetical protein
MEYVGIPFANTLINAPSTTYRVTHHVSLFSVPEAQTPRKPTILPNKNQYTAHGEYITRLIEHLGQVQTLAALNMVQAKYSLKYYYDKKLNTQDFREGEMVYALKEPRKGKLDTYYVGPFEIISIDYTKNNVVILRDNKIKILHIDKIKKTSTLKEIPGGIT